MKTLFLSPNVIAARLQPVKRELAILASFDGDEFRFALENCYFNMRNGGTGLVNDNSTNMPNRFDSLLTANYLRCD